MRRKPLSFTFHGKMKSAHGSTAIHAFAEPQKCS
jgi:hypothetical protein